MDNKLTNEKEYYKFLCDFGKRDPDVKLGDISQDYLEFSVFLKPGYHNSGPQKFLNGSPKLSL